MLKKRYIILLISTHICMQAAFEGGEEFGRDAVDAPVHTAGDLVSGALGVVSGVAKETGELLTGEHTTHHHLRSDSDKPGNVREINVRYKQIRYDQ